MLYASTPSFNGVVLSRLKIAERKLMDYQVELLGGIVLKNK
jgi:hypothetical protein